MFRQYKNFISKPLSLAWRKWWGTQTPSRQDRFAFLAPLMAVLVFMVAITSVFWYLKYEEIDREQEIVRRDVEYAQQRVRLSHHKTIKTEINPTIISNKRRSVRSRPGLPTSTPVKSKVESAHLLRTVTFSERFHQTRLLLNVSV